MGDAGFAGDRQAPELRPADEGRRGAEGERLDHVGAAADAAVDEHRHPAADRLDHGRERLNRGEGAVELAAAVVRHDEPVDASLDRHACLGRAEDAFEDQRPLPEVAQHVDVGPAHRRVEERGHAAGEPAHVDLLAGAEIVAEGDRADVAPHPPRPAELDGEAGELGEVEPRRDGEAVPDVALAVSDQLVVDGEHQRVVVGRRGALGELAGEAAVLVDEDLHPARRGPGRGERLERADRAVAETEGGAGRGRGPRSRLLALRPEQALEAGRPDDHRQREAPAEERDREVALGRAGERMRHQGKIVEGGLVSAERRLVLGRTVGEIEDGARQRPPGEPPHGGDAVGLAFEAVGVHGAAHMPRR